VEQLPVLLSCCLSAADWLLPLLLAGGWWAADLVKTLLNYVGLRGAVFGHLFNFLGIFGAPRDFLGHFLTRKN